MDTPSKTCFKCGRALPLTAFYKHADMADGYLGKCKECTKLDTRKNRLDRVEYYRDYDRKRANLPHRAAQRQRIFVAWKAEHPDRRAANIALGNAVRGGKVVPQPCFICGAEKTEGHHPDYSRPLDVVWLCRAHHMQAHAMVANDNERIAA